MAKSNKDEDSIESRILNAQEVLTAARSASNDPQVMVLEHTLTLQSDQSLGYIGTYYRLNIDIQRSSDSRLETLTFFVKALPSRCDGASPERYLFYKEANFFKSIAVQLYDVWPVERPAWSPRCHYIRNDVIVMEDLSLRGYKSLGPETYDDYDVIRLTLITLARYHACSLLLEDKWRRKSEPPATILERYPDICKDYLYDRSSSVHRLLEHGNDLTIRVASCLGYETAKFRGAFEKVHEMVRPSRVHRNALCHGDLWLNNRYYSADDCILLDFQAVRYAPMALDILQLLYLDTSSAFRARHERDLVELYHAALLESARTVGAPSLDETLLALEDLRLYGPVLACVYFPLTLIGAELAREDESPNVVFSDRTKVTLRHLQLDGSFKSKMLDVIGEIEKICETL